MTRSWGGVVEFLPHHTQKRSANGGVGEFLTSKPIQNDPQLGDGWVSLYPQTHPKTTRNWGVGESLTSTPIQKQPATGGLVSP